MSNNKIDLSKLDSNSFQEISNLEAEAVSGGAFLYGFSENINRLQTHEGNDVVVRVAAQNINRRPIQVINRNEDFENRNDPGHNFTVQYRNSNLDVLREIRIGYGEGVGVAPPPGTATARIIQDADCPATTAPPTRTPQDPRMNMSFICN